MNSKKEAFTGFLFLYVRLVPRIALLFAVGILAACASIDPSDYRQTVLVTSNPPGATIYERGQKIGTTPAYVRVRRRYHPKLDLDFGNGVSHSVQLKTHYRWGDSFGSDFLFLQFAPVGWLVDWTTGNIWRLDDPNSLAVNAPAPPQKGKPHVIAVAPPVSATLEAADAMGPLIEAKLRDSTGAKVLSYEKTAPVFGYYGSDQGINERKNEKYNLLYELKADEIFISHATANETGFAVSGSLKDIYSGKDVHEFGWDVTPGKEDLRDEFYRERFIGRYFHFLPNTIFLNFANYDPKVDINDVAYDGKSARGEGFTQQLADYVSFLSLAHLDRPRPHVKGHFVFDFVPTLNVSNKRIVYDQYGPIQNVQFNRWYAGGGYGIEIGHESRIGFFYFDLIPMGIWTQLAYSTESFDAKISRWSVNTMEELGYSYFLTSHLVIKAFLRTLNEDTGIWEQAIRDISGRSESVANASSVFTGIALGYYIPSSLKDREGWRVIEHASKRPD